MKSKQLNSIRSIY